MAKTSSTRPGRTVARAKRPEGYDADAFPRFAVTVDAVVLTVVEDRLHVLLVQRDAEPYEGAWALPGGFKRPDETLDHAAARELREETGLDASGHLAQLAAYGDPGRDPRMNVVTVAYRAVLPSVGPLAAGTDARNAALRPVDDVLDGGLSLAFDHHQILRDTLERTRLDIETSDLALSFVGPAFTLSELRTVYEAVWDVRLDPANFRRTLLGTDPHYVQPTGERSRPGAIGGRPPELYRARPEAWWEGAPLRRPRSVQRRQANRTLFATIANLREAGRHAEALELCPPQWASERAAIVADMER